MTRLARIFCAASALILSACRADMVPVVQEGALQVSIGNISSSVVESKAAPANLAKPEAADFRLSIVNNERGSTLYNGKFTDTPIKAVPGSYTVSVQAGEDIEIGYDSPFYTGSASANVPVDAMVPTPVNIQCKVANSLISVVFGGDALERSRFSALFEECEMIVDIGSKKIGIDMTGQSRSVYLRAGQDFRLSFRGTLRNDPDHTVFAYLNAEGLPSSLGAADHLIITLNPSHESGAGVEISKIDLEEAELGSTIPFSWLPVPQVSAQHVFDQEGTLLGTNVETSASFPGCDWTASIANADGVIVRTMNGSGALSSDYTDSNWPYLPSGNYTASYSYRYGDKEFGFEKTYNFSVPSPESLGLTLEGGFTSYTLYTQGDISNANRCDNGTIYAPTAKVAISEAILSNNNYRSIPVSYSSKINGTQIGSTQHKNANTCEMEDAVNLQPGLGTYTYSVDVSFDGTSVSAEDEFHITGLPVTYNPPSYTNGWSWGHKGSGSEWPEDSGKDYTKISTSSSNPSVNSPYFMLPDDTDVYITLSLYEDATLGKDFIVKFNGNNTSQSQSLPAKQRQTKYVSGTLTKGRDHITIINDYPVAGPSLRIYSVKIEYR